MILGITFDLHYQVIYEQLSLLLGLDYLIH